MSRRARVGLSPSLFPFLAVLVCTLGTLILLLALVAQNASTTAQQQAAAKQAADKLAEEDPDAEPTLTRAAVDRLIREGEFRVTQLVSFRDSQTADLEQRRDQVTHLEDHIRRVREELARLNSEVELATSDSAPKKMDETQLAELKSRLESERTQLDELRQSAQTKKPRVVIVPHKGPNGTDRRPVYLECTSAGITIWPESSRIKIEQLLATDSSANPLDAALRTVRLYAMQNYGDTIPPYPLLVVRPDGVETYIAARQAMLDWDDQFGYELVPAEVDLAFAKPDSQLKQKVDLAIREAVSHQTMRMSIAGVTSGRGGDASGGSGSSGRVRTLSAANLDRQGRSGGFGDRDRSSMRGGYSSSPNYGSAHSGDNSAARRLDQHLQNAAEEMASGQPTNFAMPGSNDAPGLGAAAGTTPTALAAGPGGASALDGTGDPSTAAGQDVYATLQRPQANANGLQQSPSGSTQKGATGFEMPTMNSAAGTSDSGSTSASNGQQGSATSQSTESNSSKDKSAGQYATGASQGGGDGGTQMQGGGSPTQQSSSSAGGQSSARGSADEAQSAQSVSASNSPPPQSTRKMLQRKGNDWALPDNVAGINGTAVVRTIRVVCYSDRLVLLPPASGGATEMFGFSDGEINRATLELASAVRDRIESWGPSLPGGRWQPRLDVEVTPDGVQRYQQLQALMNGSGVEVNGRPSQ